MAILKKCLTSFMIVSLLGMNFLGGTKVQAEGEEPVDSQTDPPVVEMADQVDLSNLNSFSITGTAEADSGIGMEISDEYGNYAGGPTSTDGEGKFGYESLNLSGFWNGPLTFKFTVTDPAGNTNYTTKVINKDASDILPPSFDLTETVKYVNQNEYIVSGSALPNTKVYIFVSDESGKQVLGQAGVNGSGNFTAPLDISSLNDGMLTFKLGIEDSAAYELSGFSTDTIEKNTVSSLQFTNDEFINLENETSYLLSGTADPNVEIYFHLGTLSNEGQQPIISDANGNFSFAIDTSPLSDENYILSLTYQNLAGETIESESGTIIKDTQAPELPTSIDIDSVVNQVNVGAVNLSGTGEPGTSVHYEIADLENNVFTAGDIPVNNDGTFGEILNLNGMQDGPGAVIAYSIDAAGNRSEGFISDGFIKDTVAPAISEFNANLSTVTSADQAIILTGVADPFTRIVLSVTINAEIGFLETETDENGLFSFELDSSGLPSGTINFAANAVDENNNVSVALEQNVLIAIEDTTAPVIFEFSANKDTITEQGEELILSGITEPLAHIVLTIMLNEESAQLEADADVNGNFTFNIDTSSFSNGTATFIVCAIDESGNESATQELNVLIAFEEDVVDDTDDIDNSGTITTTSTTFDSDLIGDTLPLSGSRNALPILLSLLFFLPVGLAQRKKKVSE